MTAWGKRRRALLGACAITLVAALTGCGGGSGPGGGGGASVVVTGTVLNSADRDSPVEGATIVMGTVSGTTITRDNVNGTNLVGTFRLENVPVGTSTATITFQNIRQVGQSDQTETFTDTQTVAFFPSVTNGSNGPYELFVNIGQVSGRILLPNGTPASGAFVSVAPSGVIATTDASGNFLVDNVPAGDVEVSAVLGTAAGTRTLAIGNGVTNIGDLQLVEDPNPNPPGFPATIVGKVTTSNGQSGAGTVVILLRNGAQVEQTIANESGDFSFYVPTGSYAVRVLKDGYNEGNATGTLTNPNIALRLDVSVDPRN